MPRPAFYNPVTFTAGRLDINGHVHDQSRMDRMISIRSHTRLAVSRQNFTRLRTVSNYAWHARINRNGS